MGITREDILNWLDEAPMGEVMQLVKDIEDKYDVSATAAAPVMMGAMPGAAAGEQEEEKTEFEVVLKEYDAKNKIKVIKVVREVTSLGLKEAKDVVEGVPSTIKEAASKEEAEEIKKKFAEVGGVIEIK